MPKRRVPSRGFSSPLGPIWEWCARSLGVQGLRGNIHFIHPSSDPKICVHFEVSKELEVLEFLKDPAAGKIFFEVDDSPLAIIKHHLDLVAPLMSCGYNVVNHDCALG